MEDRQTELRYPEIRRQAQSLAWELSRQASELSAQRHALTCPSRLQLMLAAVEWLLALAIDDWEDIERIVDELPILTFPTILPECNFAFDTWRSLVKQIAKAAERPVPQTMDQLSVDERLLLMPEMTPQQYRALGIDLGIKATA